MKEKVLIVFCDIDNTFRATKWPGFLPVQPDAVQRMVDLSKELKKEGVSIKVCFISARPSESVRDQMDELNKLSGVALSEYSVGDSGTVLVKQNDDVFFNKDTIDKLENIKKYLREHYAEQLEIFEGSKGTAMFTSKDDTYPPTKETLDFIENLKQEIESNFKDENLNISIGNRKNRIEIHDKRYDKDTAINFLFSKYQKKYNIVGMTYSGDASNDIKAIKHMAKLAEIPGIMANVFIPRNADEDIDGRLEAWKDNITGTKKVIKRAEYDYFSGVVDLMWKAYNEKALVSESIPTKTRDDINIPRRKNNITLKKINVENYTIW